MQAQTPTGKALDILHAARMLMMDRGFTGFSFRDVAEDVGMKSASIHYHYAFKADLAKAAMKIYSEAFEDAVAQFKADSASELLRAYGGLFVSTLREQGRLCLGGMLAADVAVLPDQVRDEMAKFFDAQNGWVETVLRNGQSLGEIRADMNAAELAKMFVSSLEGAMMISRGTDQPQDLEDALETLIQLVQA